MSRGSLQRHRMNRVVNFVRGRLYHQLSLDEMADIACLSKYHFARTFHQYMNETPNAFVARLKLESAARKLIVYDHSNVTQIAMDYGFSGTDSFSRSFRQRFGLSPRQFKSVNQSGFDCVDSVLNDQTYKPGEVIVCDDWLPPLVSIEYRPDYYVAYMRHIGPYGNSDGSSGIDDAFVRLQAWAQDRGVLHARSSFLGRSSDNCAITPARYCMYDVCLVLDDDIAEDDVVSVQTIPGGLYAVMKTDCHSTQINRMWDWLTTTWLASSGRRIASGTFYEFYHENGFAPMGEICDTELCMPVS